MDRKAARKRWFKAMAFLSALSVFFTDLAGLRIMYTAAKLHQVDPVLYTLQFPVWKETLHRLHNIGLVSLVAFILFYTASELDVLKATVRRWANEVGA